MGRLVGFLADIAMTGLLAGCGLKLAPVRNTSTNLGVLGDASTLTSGAPLASAGKTATVAGTLGGQVLGVDGKPAAGVPVRTFLVSNNANGYHTFDLAPFRLQSGCSATSSALSACTDAQGYWTLKVAVVASADAGFNVEAVYADDIKAMQQRALPTGQDLVLQLAYTGTIRGKVKTWVRSVTDFLGVDVFIPGTAYVAKTDRDGNYEIPNIPPGIFRLAAMHPDLGRAESAGVEVKSKQATVAADLALQTVVPGIATLQPAFAAPGQNFLIKGEGFGTSQGKRPLVLINGDAAAVVSATDTEIEATVPNGAVSGVVTVSVGGVPSNTLSLAVFKTLDIFPEYMGDEAKTTNASAPTSDELAVNRVRRYVARGVDTEGKVVGEPTVSWSISAPDVAALDSLGSLRPTKAEQVVLSARAGALVARNPVTVQVVPAIDAILMSRPEITLCPYNSDPQIPEGDRIDLPDSVYLRAVTRFFDGSTASLAVFWYGTSEWLGVDADRRSVE